MKHVKVEAVKLRFEKLQGAVTLPQHVSDFKNTLKGKQNSSGSSGRRSEGQIPPSPGEAISLQRLLTHMLSSQQRWK